LLKSLGGNSLLRGFLLLADLRQVLQRSIGRRPVGERIFEFAGKCGIAGINVFSIITGPREFIPIVTVNKWRATVVVAVYEELAMLLVLTAAVLL
jgi:hypothetical protein